MVKQGGTWLAQSHVSCAAADASLDSKGCSGQARVQHDNSTTDKAMLSLMTWQLLSFLF